MTRDEFKEVKENLFECAYGNRYIEEALAEWFRTNVIVYSSNYSIDSRLFESARNPLEYSKHIKNEIAYKLGEFVMKDNSVVIEDVTNDGFRPDINTTNYTMFVLSNPDRKK
jgi:hypothetical protein